MIEYTFNLHVLRILLKITIRARQQCGLAWPGGSNGSRSDGDLILRSWAGVPSRANYFFIAWCGLQFLLTLGSIRIMGFDQH